ncbi:MAG TPA: alpha/beta hydrolase [Acidimicrobiales bacterium]|nr:alpha/beta hydrolase [Acidimicrobiales bacterium]
MTVALVHGNPEAAAIWDRLIAELGRDDVVALSPPGFGAPVPAGFGATSDDYRDWLVGELVRLGGGVDLVGHDWGGGHVQRVAATRPDLLRSWASDIVGCMHPDYVWHDMAQIWQTPGAGEEAVAGMTSGSLEDRAAFFQSLGMDGPASEACAVAMDDAMARCILDLYRSAAQPAMRRWGEELAAAERRPALAIVPTEDPYTGGPQMATEAADRVGARVARLDGLGHWWMLQDPARGAAALTDFWAGKG